MLLCGEITTPVSGENGFCLTCKHRVSFLSGCLLTPHWWPLTLLLLTVCCFDLVFTRHWCCLFLVFIYFNGHSWWCHSFSGVAYLQRFLDAGRPFYNKESHLVMQTVTCCLGIRKRLLVKLKNSRISRSTINLNAPILWHIRWYWSYMQFCIFNGNHIFSFLTALISLINSKHALNTFSLNRVKIFRPCVWFYSSTCMHKHSYTADVDATSDEKNQSTSQIIIYHLDRVSICWAININCLNLLSM